MGDNWERTRFAVCELVGNGNGGERGGGSWGEWQGLTWWPKPLNFVRMSFAIFAGCPAKFRYMP